MTEEELERTTTETAWRYYREVASVAEMGLGINHIQADASRDPQELAEVLHGKTEHLSCAGWVLETYPPKRDVEPQD